MSEWQALGPHRYRMEQDLLFWRPNGEVRSEHASGVCALFDLLAARHGYVLWLIDAQQSVPVGYEARRVYANWFKRQPDCQMVVSVIKPPAPAQTTANLTIRGVQLVQGVQVLTESFQTEDEARAYLDSYRQTLRAQVALQRSGLAAK